MKDNKESTSAFTTRYNLRTPQLKTEIGFSGYNPTIQYPLPNIEGVALWDTGATHSAITDRISKALNLKPTGKRQVSGTNKTTIANVYLINIFLPNKVVIKGISVTEIQNIIGDFDILIGMDVITLGDFAVTHLNKKTKLSFQMPSKHDVDFVEEWNRKNKNKSSKEKLRKDRAEYNKLRRKTKRRKK